MFRKIFIKNLRYLCSFLLSLFIDVTSRNKGSNSNKMWEKNCKVISMKNLLLWTKSNMQVLIRNMTWKFEPFKAKIYTVIIKQALTETFKYYILHLTYAHSKI